MKETTMTTNYNTVLPDDDATTSKSNETHTDLIVCESMKDLKLKVNDVIKKEHIDSLPFSTTLNKCIEVFELFNAEWSVIESSAQMPLKDLKLAYESAYVYSKILNRICASIIPGMDEFKRQQLSPVKSSLMEIFNSILTKLTSAQPKFNQVKEFLRTHSGSHVLKTQTHLQIDMLNNTDNTLISTKMLHYLLKSSMWKDSLLLIDIRPKLEFEQLHVKFKSCICIEPISFKENYTDQDIVERSMITSGKDDIALFQKRHLQKFIVLYTSSKIKHYQTQLQNLRNILLKKSFKQPLDLNETRVVILKDGIEQWVASYGLENCMVNSILISNGSNLKTGPNQAPLSPPQQKQTLHSPEDPHKDNNEYVDHVLNIPVSYSNSNVQQIKSAFFNTNSMRSSPGPMYVAPTYYQQQSQQNFDQQQSVSRSSSLKKRFSYILGKDSTSPRSSSPTRSMVDLVAKYPETPIITPQSQPSPPPPTTTKESALSKMMRNSSSSVSPPSLSASPQTVPNKDVYAAASLPAPGAKPLPPLPQNRIFNNGSISTPTLQAPSTHPIKEDPDFCTGLINLGNSCYMNCIVQCLLGTKALTEIFLNDDYKDHINLNSKLGSKGLLVNYFSQLVHLMYTHQNSIVKPSHFKSACGAVSSTFKNSDQQDCQEFVQFLLDGLHEDLNQCGHNPALKELSEQIELKREKYPMRLASSIEWERYLTTDFSVILDLFQGQYSSRLQCQVCKRTSTTYQPFSVLSVPIPQNFQPHKINKTSLFDCFREFTKTEVLGKDEWWNCPGCKKKQPSTKKITITRLPKNLIINLKRFDNSMNKNNEFVYYPHELDLTTFWFDNNPEYINFQESEWTNQIPLRGQVPPFKYALYAVACHSGTLYGGHYTAYVKKKVQQGHSSNWFYFDDSNIRRVKNENEPISSSAYVLFYKKL